MKKVLLFSSIFILTMFLNVGFSHAENKRVLCKPMLKNSIARSCNNYQEKTPVYKKTENACLSYCSSMNANACEYEKSTHDCYVEFGTDCTIYSDYKGWSASVDSCRAEVSSLGSMLTSNAIDAVGSSTEEAKTPIVGDKYNFTKKIKVGSTGADVKALQRKLNKLGYKTGNFDGVFGHTLKKAVMQYQKDNGLKADGVVGEGVQNLLNQ